MAKLSDYANYEFWEWKDEEDIGDYYNRCDDELDRLCDESDRVFNEGKSVVGLLVTFPVADGYAYYKVVKAKPLTLEHIPFGDKWEIPDAYMRGLTVKDIKMRAHRNW